MMTYACLNPLNGLLQVFFNFLMLPSSSFPHDSQEKALACAFSQFSFQKRGLLRFVSELRTWHIPFFLLPLLSVLAREQKMQAQEKHVTCTCLHMEDKDTPHACVYVSTAHKAVRGFFFVSIINE